MLQLPNSTGDIERVAAVVVTFNRKEALGECLESLLAQTRPLDRIYVIDNASTDGTTEFVQRKFFGNSEVVEYVRLPVNTGGAGGFQQGVKCAFEAGFDFIWLMDDDGCPDTDCLRLLFSHRDAYDVVGPLIISNEDPARSSFPYYFNGKPCNQVEQLVKCEVIDHVQPFNGILVGRGLVESIGLPDHRFFIWGDEENYRLRWHKAGFSEATLVCARFRHPSGGGFERENQRRVMKGALALIMIQDRNRKYLYYRNRFYNLLRYHGGIAKRGAKALLTVLAVIACEPDKRVALTGLFDGLVGNFSHTTRYAEKQS